MTKLGLALLITASMLLGGCGTLSHAPDVDFARPAQADRAEQRVESQLPATRSGSLFDATRYRAAFEEPRARQVGDIVLVRITETIAATQSSTSSVEKSGSATAGITNLPLFAGQLNDRTRLEASSSNEFSGEGQTSSTNTFSGTITTTVVEVKPNGHLVVAGEKQIGLNENVDVLKFTGTVNPRTLKPGNVVASSDIADVRIASRNRGAQGESLAMGWLARFFLSVLPF
jgi:flagellar L-ring protein precursor FlgH